MAKFRWTKDDGVNWTVVEASLPYNITGVVASDTVIVEPIGNEVTESALLWTPAQLYTGGLAGACYSIAELSSMSQLYDSAVPVTADGDRVGRLSDYSGNNNHLLQSTATKRPTYKTDGTLHWIVGDNLDDFLSVTFPANISQPVTWFVAGQADAATGYTFDSPSGVRQAYGGVSSAVYLDAFAGSVGTDSLAPKGASNFISQICFNGASSTHRFNGSVPRAFAPVNIGANATSGIQLLTRQGGTNPFSGKIFEVGCVAGEISASNVIRLNQYLATKAGVTL